MIRLIEVEGLPMNDHANNPTNDYLIVANGDFLVKEIISEAAKNKTIVALDGAAMRLKNRGIMPDIILGDFDSTQEDHAKYWGIQQRFAELKISELKEAESRESELTNNSKSYLGNFGITIAPRINQQFTDLAKAIHYCDEKQANSITIICALGGRLDLQEAALRNLRVAHNKHRPLLLHSSQQTIRFVKDETLTVLGLVGDKCGIISYPKARFSSHGLLYDVNNFELNFGFTESTANEMRLPQASISVQGEALIIMPPQLTSQREFTQMPEARQLELLLRDAAAQ
jgi:thiamine pyrophosphokinase